MIQEMGLINRDRQGKDWFIMIKRVLCGIGLTTWALGSITCLGIGIYGGITQYTDQHTGQSCTVGASTGHNLMVASDNAVIVVPVVEATVVPVTDNTPCGSGCVRASFTVVSK